MVVKCLFSYFYFHSIRVLHRNYLLHDDWSGKVCPLYFQHFDISSNTESEHSCLHAKLTTSIMSSDSTALIPCISQYGRGTSVMKLRSLESHLKILVISL